MMNTNTICKSRYDCKVWLSIWWWYFRVDNQWTEWYILMTMSSFLWQGPGLPLYSPDLIKPPRGPHIAGGAGDIFYFLNINYLKEIKQIIWQAVYIFRSIRWGDREPPCRWAVDQSELSWDNPSCQSVKSAAWWDPATARIIFWILTSTSIHHYDAWLGKYL